MIPKVVIDRVTPECLYFLSNLLTSAALRLRGETTDNSVFLHSWLEDIAWSELQYSETPIHFEARELSGKAVSEILEESFEILKV